jgi:hypothetical protein
MIALFIIGTVLALAHHFYYETLNGTEVMPTKSNWTLQGIKSGQEWKIRYGTAFAFMTKTTFCRGNSICLQGAHLGDCPAEGTLCLRT